MEKLDSVSVSSLQEALDSVETAKEAKRLIVALAYKDSVSVQTLCDRYGLPQSTVYYWLDRFESGSLEDAVVDDSRPGRPPELTAAQRRALDRWLDEPPTAIGREGAEWTPELLRDQIADVFCVEYSLGHTRRLLNEHNPE